MAVIGQPQSAGVVYDPGIYEAWINVRDADHETMSSYQGQEEKLRLKFHVMTQRPSESGEGVEESDIWYFTNSTLSKHPAAKFRPLVKAVFPDLNLDDPALQVDSRTLDGHWVRVLLGIDEDPEKNRNVIEKVLPFQQETRRPATTARPAAPKPNGAPRPAPRPVPAQKSNADLDTTDADADFERI